MTDKRYAELSAKLARIIMDDDKFVTSYWDEDADGTMVECYNYDEKRLKTIIEEFLITQGLEE